MQRETSNKKKWNNVNTKKLIRLKHSETYITKQKNAENNPRKLNKFWGDLTNDIDSIFTAKDVRSKYNSLLSTYRVEYAESNKSGFGASTWKFCTLFRSTCPKNMKIVMEKVKELGDSSINESKNENIDISMTEIKTNSNKKKSKKEIFNEKIENLYDLFNKKLEIEIKSEEKINVTVENLSTEIQNMKESISEILDSLKKNK